MGSIQVFDADGNEYEMEIPDEGGTAAPADNAQRSNSEWAQLRRAEKKARDAETNLTALAKQLAFIKAGIDPDNDRMKYFVKGYDGDLNPDAMRAAAVAAGFLADTGQPPTQQLTAEQQAALAASQAISAANPGSAPDLMTATQKLDEAYKSGGTAAMLAALAEQGIPIAGQ
jgi:hypothetical protein